MHIVSVKIYISLKFAFDDIDNVFFYIIHGQKRLIEAAVFGVGVWRSVALRSVHLGLQHLM